MLDSKAYKELKSKAKVTKPDMKKQLAKKTKAKGLAVLSKISLSEAKQIKMVTKRSKKDFHIPHASGSGDGVDTQSNVLDDNKESWGDSEGNDDYDDEGDNDDDGNNDDAESNVHDDERTESNSDEIPDPNWTNVDQTVYEEEYVDEGTRTPFDDELTDE
nr:hypothetical protein [Tanacetum cinerariifolium]